MNSTRTQGDKSQKMPVGQISLHESSFLVAHKASVLVPVNQILSSCLVADIRQQI